MIMLYKDKIDKPSFFYLTDEKNIEIEVEGHTLVVSNPNKIFWKEERYTKMDLINYYSEIANYILPYLNDRPESLNRHPNGIEGISFFQKDIKTSPPNWVKTIKIHSESAKKEINYLVCQNKATLIYMCNLGCIEINPWSSKIGRLNYPDFAIIDLDPLEISFNKVIEVAQGVKEVLMELEIKGYCKTSGATGLHIYIPMGAQYTYEQVREFAHFLAYCVYKKIPGITSLERSPLKRNKKVYLDYLQNSYGQTLAAPYCIRPKKGATISMPLDWDEVTKGLKVSDFTIQNALERIRKKGDLFKPILRKGINLEAVMRHLEEKMKRNLIFQQFINFIQLIFLLCSGVNFF